MLSLLREQEPSAYQRLLAKLVRAELASTALVLLHPGAGAARSPEPHPLEQPVTSQVYIDPDLYAEVPSERVLARARTFAEDKSKVRLGRLNNLPHLPLLVSIVHCGIEETLRAQGHSSPSMEAWRVAAEKFGYKDLESAKVIASRIPRGWKKSLSDSSWRAVYRSLAHAILRSGMRLPRARVKSR